MDVSRSTIAMAAAVFIFMPCCKRVYLIYAGTDAGTVWGGTVAADTRAATLGRYY